MKAIVGKDIVIRNPTEEFLTYASSMLTFDNPDYLKRLRMNKWVGRTPKKLFMMQSVGLSVILPFGMLPFVFRHRNEFDEGIFNLFEGVRPIDYHSKIILYDYQEKAVQRALKARQGVIVAPCGSGKTQIGLELAARIGGKTLWITHTQDLLTQSKNRALANFELAASDYGEITAGKIQIGRGITFSTVQTLSRVDLGCSYSYWDTVIVDECHHAVGSPTKVTMFYNTMSRLQARYKYGLTATPNRADGLTESMYRILGDKVCEITKADVANNTCPVEVRMTSTDYFPEDDSILNPDGTINYMRMINSIARDEARNALIIQDVLSAHGSCLVLSDRVEHAKRLSAALREAGESTAIVYAINSKKGRMEREDAIAALNDGRVRILLATFALAKEGLDVPSLRNVFFATPQKNESILTQAAGRVARKAVGKSYGTLWDYVDNFGMLKGWGRKRLNFYKRSGFILQ